MILRKMLGKYQVILGRAARCPASPSSHHFLSVGKNRFQDHRIAECVIILEA